MGMGLFTLLSCVPRSLCLEDWKKANPETDEKKFTNYWRKLPSDQKQARRSLPSHLILADVSDVLNQPYENRANGLVRHRYLRYSS